MRAVLVTYGTEGDTRPYLSLAAALRRAGHSVVVCAEGALADIAARHGIDFVPLAGDLRTMMGDHRIGEFTRRGGSTARGLDVARRLLEQYLASWMTTAAEAAQHADIVVYGGLALSVGTSVAELYGIPAVAGSLQPLLGSRELSWPVGKNLPPALRPAATEIVGRLMFAAFRPGLDRARRAVGLPPRRRIWRAVPAVCGWSPALVPKPAAWPPSVVVTGDWPLPEPGWDPPDDLVEWLEAGEPPVYVGFGSLVPDQAMLSTVLAGLAGRRVLLAPGWGNASELRKLPRSVHLVGHVPHDWLFPRTAAVMHACGAGTTHATVRAGVVSIPVPFNADQPFWASRLVSLGIGTHPLDPRRLRAADVAEAVEQASETTIRGRANAMAERLATDTGPETAVAALERAR